MLKASVIRRRSLSRDAGGVVAGGAETRGAHDASARHGPYFAADACAAQLRGVMPFSCAYFSADSLYC
jgi:hypothetical protein